MLSFSNLNVYEVILKHRNKDHGDEVLCLAEESFSFTYTVSHQQDSNFRCEVSFIIEEASEGILQ